METQIRNGKYLGRGIHNVKFAESLMNGNLKQMLKVINKDKDLDVQIRKDYLNIYYKGGNIAKVNSEKSIEFDKFYFYTNMKVIPKKDIKEDEIILQLLISKRDNLISKFKVGKYEEYFADAKEIMDEWLKKNPKPERMEQHQLSIENKYNISDYTIIDLEYQVSILCDFACLYKVEGKDKPKTPRFDIIAIDKKGKLCVIELKKGTESLKDTSGLKEHWDCYKQSIERNYEPFMSEMNKLLKQKQAFSLIDNRLEIKNPIPEFMFAYSYDKKTKDYEQDKVFQIEYNKIGEPIHVIKLAKGSLKLMD